MRRRTTAVAIRRARTSRRRSLSPSFLALEERLMLTGTIAGYVYDDANGNGLVDSGEAPLSGARVLLLDSSGSVVDTTTTDAAGLYEFSADVPQPAATLTETLTFPEQYTNFADTGMIPQFDPTQGTLTSVDIINDGSITSEFFCENLSTTSATTVTATFGGSLALNGPSVTSSLTVGPTTQTYNLSTYDGTLDFGGPSGCDSGPITNSATETTTLTAPSDLAPYIGTGSVMLSDTGNGSSSDSAPGGNLDAGFATRGTATITVVYHYVPLGGLPAGNYSIVQDGAPAGYLEGLASSDGVVLPSSAPTDSIPVTLTGSNDSLANDFGDVQPVSLSGNVFDDVYNTGVYRTGDVGVGAVVVTLTGTDDLGRPVFTSTDTAPDGSYVFAHLYPGTYSVLETPPPTTIVGKIAAGSAGGTVGNEAITGITLGSGTAAVNYDFGYDRPPTFTSMPPDQVVVNEQYVYTAAATDPDGDALTYTLLGGPAGMNVTSSGQVTWTPSSTSSPSDVGTHAIGIQVSDGRGGTAEQDFTITVVQGDEPNPPPIFTSTPVVDAYVGEPYTYDATAWDADDSDLLTFSVLDAPSGMAMNDPGPTGPTQEDPQAGVIQWTPTVSQLGLNTVKLSVNNGYGGTAEQDFQVLVQPVPGTLPPVIVSAPVTMSYPPNEYQYQVVAIDPQHSPLTYSLLDAPSGMSIDSQTGLITWDDPSNQVESVTVQAADALGGTAQQTYQITPDVVLLGSEGSTDDLLYSPYPTDPSDPNAGSDMLTIAESGDFPNPFVAATVGSYGSYTGPIDNNPVFSPNPAGSDESGYYELTFNLNGPLNDPWLVITANTDDAGAAFINGNLITDSSGNPWVFDEYGSYSITEQNAGWLVQGENTLLFAVDNSGGGPTAISFEANVLQANQSLPPQITSTPPTGATVNQPFEYLVRATDPDGSALTYSVQPTTEGGTVPAGVSIDPNTGLVTWTPTADEAGSQTFTVVATNGAGLSASQAVPLTVSTSNFASSSPILLNRPGFAGVGVGVPYTFTADGYDADGAAIRYSLPIAPAGMVIDPITGVLGWTPTANETGNQQFMILLSDDEGQSTPYMFQVSMPGVNQNPIFTSSPSGEASVGEPYAYQAGAIDPDGDPITYSLDPSDPPSVSLDPDVPGLVLWTPTAAGSISVTIDASDGNGGTASQTVTLTAVEGGGDDTPDITSQYRTTEQVGRVYQYQVAATDPGGYALTYSLVSPPAGASISAAGLVSWPTTTTQLGLNTFEVEVNNGAGGVATQQVNVTVQTTEINSAPVITSTPPLAAVVGTTYYYAATAADADNDPLAWSLTTAPAGTIVDAAAGVVAWTPTADELGAQPITVRVDDGQGGYATQPFTVQVVGADEPPAITSTPSTEATSGVAYSYQVAANSPEGLPLTYSLASSSDPNMTIDPSTGLLTLTNPDPFDYGTQQSVEVEVQDTLGGAAFQSYTLEVNVSPPNQPPAITSTPGTADVVGVAYQYNIVASDPDGDTVTLSLGTGAPSWLSLSGTSLSGTPDATGNYPVTVIADDGDGDDAYQSFTLVVMVNHPPTLSPIPAASVAAGATYEYTVQASDPDGDPLTYSLTYTVPSGVAAGTAGPSIDRQGDVTWQPGAALEGTTWPVTVTVTDPWGASDSQSYNLSVVADTTPPSVIVQTSSDEVNVGQPVTVTVEATDNVAVSSLSLTEDGQPVALNAHGQATVTLSTAGTVAFVGSATDPSGNVGTSPTAAVTVIDPSVTDEPTGVIASLASSTLATNGIDATTHLPTFAPVTIGPGASITSTITVNDPATVQSLALLLSLTDADDSGLTATLTGPNGHTVTLFSGLSGSNLTNTTFDDGASTGIDTGTAPYTGTYQPQQALSALAGAAASGTYTLTITNSSATDSATVTGWTLTYRKSPSAEVTAPVEIIGTATDAQQLASWALTVTPAGSGNTTTLGSGTSPVVNGALGGFDPTMLPDGPYDLELTVTNTGGRTTVVDQTIDVTGCLKLGNLHLSFTDLTIPLAGIPITITRTYDTINANTKGDFGYGWTLDEGNGQLQVTQPDGSSGSAAPFQDGTRVTITLPGGQPETFTFEPQPEVTGYFATPYYDPTFVPDPGVTDTLTVEDDTLIDNGDGTYSGLDADLTPYTPADPTFGGSYTLTTSQGFTYVIDAATGALETESDRNGNTLTFTDSGIYSNSGRDVTFTRDPSTNDITAITDPRGDSIIYSYDPNTGDLLSVTDRDGNTTQFVYDTRTPHYLDQVIDADYVTAMQVTYTSTGRVSGITDALGNTTTITTDDAGSFNESVTAPGSSPTAVVYDAQGNATETVDAAGYTSSATYSGNNLTSQTQTVDGTSATTTYTYDAYGDVLTSTDAMGAVTRYSYNALGQPVSSTDALGDTTLLAYDANGNLLSSTNPDGVTASMTYDADGNVLSSTTPDGTASSTYDAYGDVASTTDAQGTTTTYSYDADGNQTGSQWTWVNGSVQQVMTTTNVYDANDNLIQSQAADGTVTDTVYDSSGHAIWTDVPHVPGQPCDGTQTTYDADGRVISTVQYQDVVITINNPNSSAPTSVITSYGNPFSETDTVYDAQGRVQWTDDPYVPGQPCDGTLTTYDAAGNANGTQRYANVVISIGWQASTLTSKGAQLSSTSSTYDASGNVTSTTSASGAVTTYQYNAAGQQTESQTTADGVTTTTSTSYDAVGRVTSTTDALNNTTRSIYNGDGTLIETVYPNGTFSKLVYDANGRKIASIDQDDNETDYQYNAYGELTAVLLPAVTNPSTGQTVQPTYTYTYDAYGNLTSETNPLNETTSYTYDAFGDKVSETLPMGETETWTYNALGQLASSTDFDGNTLEYTYDDQGRVTEKDEYAPGATSASVTVTYTYDNLDANNDGGYDDTVTTPDGTTTSYYDVNGNLVEIASPQGTINYTYDPATGEETSVSTSNTDIQYAYDLLGRMTTVTVDTLDGTALTTSLVTTYSYDANGELLTTDFPNGTVETRTYDANGQLASIETTVAATGAVVFGASYTRDADGNILTDDETTNTGTRSETYTYDADGRLIEEAITDPVAGNRTLTWTYDLAGNRDSSTDSGAPLDQQSLTYAYNADGELTDVSGNGYYVSYSYDADGNTLSVSGSQQATYTWDLEGRMIGASVTTNGVTQTTSYEYDDAGNLVSETVGNQTTTYLNDPNQAYDQVLEEYTGSMLAATYVRGLDLLFQDRSGVQSYYAVDQLGSTRALTNSSGAVTDTYTYDAYGDLIGSTGTTTNEYLYAGYQTDAVTGLDYLRARYYDAAGGVFTARDSFDGGTDAPLSLNGYLYAYADPVNDFDPTGHYVLPGQESLVGTYVNNYLSRQFEAPGGRPVNDRWGNRWVSTIAKGIIGAAQPVNRLRPDEAEFNRATYSGVIYEVRHVPGDDIGNVLAVAAALAGAQQTVTNLYIPALQSAVPGSHWGYGSSWMNGLTDWGPINTLIPATTGSTTGGDHLLTLANYAGIPGAMAWASVSPNEETDETVNVLVGLGGLAAVAALGIAREYAYAQGTTHGISLIVSQTAPVGLSGEVSIGVGVATTNNVASGGAV